MIISALRVSTAVADAKPDSPALLSSLNAGSISVRAPLLLLKGLIGDKRSASVVFISIFKGVT